MQSAYRLFNSMETTPLPTLDPVYKFTTDKLQLLLISMLIRSILEHLEFHKVV